MPTATPSVMLWTLGGSLRDRLSVAAGAGLGSVGFVSEPSRWSPAEVDAARTLLEELGLRPVVMSGTPNWRSAGVSMVDPAQQQGLLREVTASARRALDLGIPMLLVMAGATLEGVPRKTQTASLIESCKRCAEIAERHGLELALEPLNSALDHPGYFLTDCREAAVVICAVDSPRVRLVFDVYHQQTQCGNALSALRETIRWTSVVHLADAPGRHEPGSGAIDWPALRELLRAERFEGALSYEYLHTGDPVLSLRRTVELTR